MLPESPDFGAVINHCPVAVTTPLAHVAFGSKTSVASGGCTLKLPEVIVWPKNLTVTGPLVLAKPLGLSTASLRVDATVTAPGQQLELAVIVRGTDAELHAPLLLTVLAPLQGTALPAESVTEITGGVLHGSATRIPTGENAPRPEMNDALIGAPVVAS